MIKKIILTLAMMLFATKAWAMDVPNIPAAIALQKLKDGNERFSSLQMKHPNETKARREKLINGQHPYAIIITCCDSRVSPELIFDQGLGDILVIRNAGNLVDKKTVKYIDYAVHTMGINLVVVMGHEFCTEVGSALKDANDNPFIDELKVLMAPVIARCKEEKKNSFESIIKENTISGVNNILNNKEISEYIKRHDLKVLPAYYAIGSGQVEFLK